MGKQNCPMRAIEVLNAGFLENRARLLEIAAFLDRIDRAGDPVEAGSDFRYRALRKALEMLATLPDNRAKALQLSFSDPTRYPIESAKDLKGACGAWKGGER